MFEEVSEMTALNPLKLARLERGFSQWDVAKRTGISQTMISLYEREYREPNDWHMAQLAKLYGKKVKELWK